MFSRVVGRMRGLVVLLILGVVPLLAGAAEAEPARYENSRWTRVGLEGAVVSDGTGVGSIGAQVALGRRVGGLHLVGEYALSHGWGGDDSHDSAALGVGHRAGASLALPVTFARVSDGSMELAFWLEAGGGAHRLAGADEWRRNAFLGWAAEYRGKRPSCGGARGGMGFWFGGRVLVSEPASGTRAIAAGGATPQQQPGFGVGFIATFALRWGR